MEYFIGAVLTLVGLFIYEKFVKPKSDYAVAKQPMLTQSYAFLQLKQYQVAEEKAFKPKNRQSLRFLKQGEIRVIYMENKAYWIENNRLVVADANNQTIDKETKKEVDTYTMDSVQLDKTIFIVEKLREGMLDEGGYSGKSEL